LARQNESSIAIVQAVFSPPSAWAGQRSVVHGEFAPALTALASCRFIRHMSKKRPRETRAGFGPRRDAASATHWRRRVFKNSYTYRGRRVPVRHWSVKIQHQRVRRTVALVAKSRAAAAIEAQAVHQTILTQGWGAVTPPERRAGGVPGRGIGARPEALARTDVRYWKPRLLRRRQPFPTDAAFGVGLSTRIEHAGTSQYFPLGTTDEEFAAARAREIYLAVVKEGWEAVQQRFPRELTVGLHWAERPLAWTYATIHTRVEGPAARIDPAPARLDGALQVAVVETDPGLRRALRHCVNSQRGFACAAAYSSARESLTALARQPPHLALVNGSSSNLTGAELSNRLRRLAPSLPILFFTVHEDSDQLFKATPGGAPGYLLKRTAANRLFEPIVGALRDGELSADRIAQQVRGYFQIVVESLSTPQPARGVAKLTHREHDILSLLSKGYLDKEIADSLGISLWTVHGHLKKIYEKLGVHTRTEAAVRYLQK
jgi:DNA-binding NarL/FixJ family response regulator